MQIARGRVQLVALVVSIVAAIFLAMLATGAVMGQQHTIRTANGQTYVGHNSEFAVVATFPAALRDDDKVVIPMVYQPSVYDGLIYQGDQPIPGSMMGERTYFLMHAVGFPGDTIEIRLVQMSKRTAMLVRFATRDSDGRARFAPSDSVEIVGA